MKKFTKPPKFNKKNCLKCIYRGVKESTSLGAPVTIKNENGEERVAHVYCNYASITGETCIRLTEDHKNTMDIRGKGPRCKMFKEGNSLSRDIKPM